MHANQNEIGWNLIGFEGKLHYHPPIGFYDGESKAAWATVKSEKSTPKFNTKHSL